MFMKSSKSATYIKAQDIIMHLLCDKDCKIEDDYSNYAEKNSSRNKVKAYILKEIEVNGKLLFLQIVSTYLNHTLLLGALWSETL